jgi:hypothetical protein
MEQVMALQCPLSCILSKESCSSQFGFLLQVQGLEDALRTACIQEDAAGLGTLSQEQMEAALARAGGCICQEIPVGNRAK